MIWSVRGNEVREFYIDRQNNRGYILLIWVAYFIIEYIYTLMDIYIYIYIYITMLMINLIGLIVYTRAYNINILF